MKPILLDTDILSFFFRNRKAHEQQATQQINDYLKANRTFSISIITYYELLNGLYFADTEERTNEIDEFLRTQTILPISKEIAKKAAQIYATLKKEGNSIAHNDILIAATAIVEGYILITNNEKHFGRIDELQHENWSKL